MFRAPGRKNLTFRAIIRRRQEPWLLFASALFFALAVGFAIDANAVLSPPALLILAILLIGTSRLVAGGTEARRLIVTSLFAFTVRFLVAAALYDWSISTARGGFVTGDDRGYSELAWAFASLMHGTPDPAIAPPAWGGIGYLFGAFVYLASSIYYVFGKSPLLVILVNAAFSVMTIVFVWDMVRRVFGVRAAHLTALVLAIEPSFVLFSALFLKDALALLLASVVLWCSVRFQMRPAWSWIAFPALCIPVMYSIRPYEAVVLVAVMLLAVLVSPQVSGVVRATWSATGAIACGGALLLALSGGGASLPVLSLSELEHVRAAMAVGANTAFSTESPAIKEQMPPTTSLDPPRQVFAPVAPPTIDDTPLPAIGRSAFGLIVVLSLAWLISRAGRNPWVAGTVLIVVALALVGVAMTRLLSLTHAPRSEVAALGRTLQYLPLGLANVLFAPFPWAAKRLIDVLTMPESLAWYVLLSAAVVTMRMHRDARRSLVAVAAFVVAMLVILTLTEGNVGTLLRHRTMSVGPFVVALAMPFLVSRIETVRARLRRTPLNAPP